jgi:tetratricopeptide (TPR) repeat protein
MLENRSCRTGWAGVRNGSVLLRCVCAAFLLSMASLASAQTSKSGQMSKSGGPAKPLPAKSNPTAFFTPEGQQQIADAILTEVVDQLSDQADAHFDNGEYNHSVNLCRIVVQANPRRVDAFGDAAYLLWSTGQNDAAITLLKQGLAANPSGYYMYDELGAFYYFRLKDSSNAIKYYEQAVKYPDCQVFTWTGLAHSYEKLNQWDKAVQAWEHASNFVGDKTIAAQVARSNSDMIKHNLTRAKAELAKHQRQ